MANSYLYLLCRAHEDKFGENDKVTIFSKTSNFEEGETLGFKRTESQITFTDDGLYLFDVGSFLEKSKFVCFPIMRSIVGANSLVNWSYDSSCISYLGNFNQLSMISFPHSNTIHLRGMRKKSDYLIWRQKNGFFAALNHEGNLLTWSMSTGELLHQRKID